MNTRTTNSRLTLVLASCASAFALVGAGGCFSSSESPGGADVGGDTVEADAPDDGVDAATMTALIERYSVLVADEVAAFETAASALSSACGALAASPGTETRSAARAAWTEAMSVWQRLELMQVGPAARMADSAGGEGLRDEIYSWPIDNPCRVDLVVASQSYRDGGLEGGVPSERGLDALEYLLFVDSEGNACGETSSINTEGTWEALGAGEVTQRRADYAATAAELVSQAATALRAQWAPDTGAFRAALVTAGQGSALYSTRRDAVNAISNALFYLDKETKDMKLARPAGLSGCADPTCPDEVESFYSRTSADHIEVNLRAFSDVYFGGGDAAGDVGFHDLLIAVGASELAAEMATAIANALEAAAASDESLFDRVTNDVEGVIALHGAVKTITDIMKSQFVVVLDLDLPQRAAGDND